MGTETYQHRFIKRCGQEKYRRKDTRTHALTSTHVHACAYTFSYYDGCLQVSVYQTHSQVFGRLEAIVKDIYLPNIQRRGTEPKAI